jgi:hypothetical protein
MQFHFVSFSCGSPSPGYAAERDDATMQAISEQLKLKPNIGPKNISLQNRQILVSIPNQ